MQFIKSISTIQLMLSKTVRLEIEGYVLYTDSQSWKNISRYTYPANEQCIDKRSFWSCTADTPGPETDNKLITGLEEDNPIQPDEYLIPTGTVHGLVEMDCSCPKPTTG